MAKYPVSTNASSRQWQVESRRTLYDGFYRIDSVEFKHDLYRGGSTPVIEREMFVRGNVVGVLPYDPVNDTVALIEQFRIGAMYQTPDPWLVEIIAGMIDTNETPEQVAIREAKEEAGIELDSVELVSHYLASPGASPEEVFVYYAQTDLSQVGGTHGLEHEHEDILVKIYPADVAIGMLDTREVRNSLSIIALQWLKAKRLESRVG